MEFADDTVAGLKQLLSIKAAHGEQAASASWQPKTRAAMLHVNQIRFRNLFLGSLSVCFPTSI